MADQLNRELLSAVNENKLEAVRGLLKNPKVHVDKLNCLHWAVTFGRVEMTKLLVDAGANVNKAGMAGNQTPLAIALSHRHQDIILYLLENGADPDVQSSGHSKDFPLLLANDTVMVDLLLKYGASLHLVDFKGQTALLKAVSMKNVAVAERLLKVGANVDQADNDGYTPLIMAAERGFDDMIKLLLKYNADIEICAASGRSAYEIATKASIKRLFETHRPGKLPASNAVPIKPTAVIQASAPPAPTSKDRDRNLVCDNKDASVDPQQHKKRSWLHSLFRGTRSTEHINSPVLGKEVDNSENEKRTARVVAPSAVHTPTLAAAEGTFSPTMERYRGTPTIVATTTATATATSAAAVNLEEPLMATISVVNSDQQQKQQQKQEQLERRVLRLEEIVEEQRKVIETLVAAGKQDESFKS